MRVGIYARVSTGEQQSIPMQLNHLQKYADLRNWKVTMICQEVASGALTNRPQQMALIEAAQKREIDAILVWKLDRWNRDLGALITSINELLAFGVAFISYTETLDFSTPQGRAMAGMIGVFANFERDVLKDRVNAGIADAKRRGVQFGRPKTINNQLVQRMQALSAQGQTHLEIARTLGVGRTSVLRLLGPSKAKPGRRATPSREESVDHSPQLLIIDFLRRLIVSNKQFERADTNNREHLSKNGIEFNFPCVIQDRVHYPELTEDRPKSTWEIEAAAQREYEWSEEGIRERFPFGNQRLPYREFGDNTEYYRIAKFLIERQKLLDQGWTLGTIKKLLGKPHFVVTHDGYLPWYFWYKRDVMALQGTDEFDRALKRSFNAKEQKLKSDKTKLNRLKDYLSKTKITAPNISFEEMIYEVCETENRRRSRKGDEYAEWECQLNIRDDVQEVYKLSRLFLHKQMKSVSNQILSKFGAANIEEAQSEVHRVIDAEIRKKLKRYKSFSRL